MKLHKSLNVYKDVTDEEHINEIRRGSLQNLGYFLKPDELFSAVLAKGQAPSEEEDTHIIEN